MSDPTPVYTSADAGDGFSVETNTGAPAPVETSVTNRRDVTQSETESETSGTEPETVDAPEPADPAQLEEPAEAAATDPNAQDKLTPFRKGAKPRDDAFARMKQATDKLAESNRLRESAEARVRELEARLAPRPNDINDINDKKPAAPPAGQKFPTFDAYLATNPEATWDDWNDAKIDYVAEAKLTAREAQQAARKVADAHGARMAAIGTKYPDYAAVVATADQTLAAQGITALPPVLEQAILRSPQSDDLAYFLATHLEETALLARRFANRPVTDADLVQDLLETKLRASAASSAGSASSPVRSTAKPPVNPVGGSVSATPQPVDDLDFGPDYVRKQNKRDLDLGRRTW